MAETEKIESGDQAKLVFEQGASKLQEDTLLAI
jgi:hypothetical protein